jgi:phospholipase A1
MCSNATPPDVTLDPMKVIHLAIAGALLPVSVAVSGQGLESCRSIDDDTARLACYDRAARRAGTVPSAPADEPLPEEKPTKAGDFVGGGNNNVEAGDSRLGFKWELDDDTRYGVLRFRTHKPNYFLPVSYNGDPNETPVSPSLGPLPTTDLRDVEAKFQLSFKTKIIEGALNDRLDIWAAYTQQSNWQLYSPSAPFRETNYEPEVMALLHTDWNLLGLRLRFINFGFVHQSNGRGGAQSRSWNRLYAQFALERGGFVAMLRPWYRLHENMGSGAVDNNPDILHYYGHGDLTLFYRPEGSGHSYAAVIRQNFSSGKGSVQFDWRFPLYRNLKGYLQLFNGYGESLIDYNYRESVFGLGISLSDWM